MALFTACFSIPHEASADWWDWWNWGNNGGNKGGNNGGGGNDVPLDGGLSLLAAAGVGYGVKKVAEKRKKNQA